MIRNRIRYARPLTLAVIVLLSSVLLIMNVYAVVPENRDSMQSYARNSTTDDRHPVADAVTDAADAIGNAVTDAGDAVGEVIGDIGNAAGELVSDAGDAVGNAADAIGGNADHREDAAPGTVGGNAGATGNAPSASGTMPYDSQNTVTPGGNTAGTVNGDTAENSNTAGFGWVWILVLTAAAAAIFFLLLMPGRRRET